MCEPVRRQRPSGYITSGLLNQITRLRIRTTTASAVWAWSTLCNGFRASLGHPMYSKLIDAVCSSAHCLKA